MGRPKTPANRVSVKTESGEEEEEEDDMDSGLVVIIGYFNWNNELTYQNKYVFKQRHNHESALEINQDLYILLLQAT